MTTSQDDRIERLSTTECWRLFESRSFGRLAVDGLDGMPDIFPVNYLVHDGALYIRTAPGSKLMAVAAMPVAAFEIDGEDTADAAVHWSVVIRGAVRRLAVDAEIRESGILRLVTANPTGKYNFVRLTPSTISGRRFAAGWEPAAPTNTVPVMKVPFSAHEPTRPSEDGSVFPTQPRATQPIPIPHFPPPEQ